MYSCFLPIKAQGRMIASINLKGDGVETLYDGKKLRALRKARGLTAQDLAEKVQLSQSYISRFENNKAVPNIDIMHTILKALGTDISSFYAESSTLNSNLSDWIETGQKLSDEERQLVIDTILALRK